MSDTRRLADWRMSTLFAILRDRKGFVHPATTTAVTRATGTNSTRDIYQRV